MFLQNCNRLFISILIFYRLLLLKDMGFTTSKQQQALITATRIREDLYLRVQNFKQNHQRAFAQIDADLKKRILISSGRQISDMIDNKQVTTLQVVYIFIQRTINTGVRNNYVFDEMFEEAVAEAIQCDEVRKRDGYKKKSFRPGMNPDECYPPFFGIPASIKQTMIMKGRQIHVGFVSKVNPLTDHDGLFVTMVRKMGFIPIARSNVPQGCKTMETNNNIFGYCKNPWNKDRSCGGSSGGESGMVASYSVPVGFGSDIGGSLRIPAAFTGLITMKPYNRYSRMGNCYYGKFTGGLPIKSELGPITRTVEDLILVNNFLFNPQNYKQIPLQQQDPFIYHIPMKMQIVEEQKKLKIGVIRRLKYARSSKSNERALNEAVQILKNNGHQIIDNIQLGNVEKLYFFLINIFTFDQKLHLFSQFRGEEPLTVEYKIFKLVAKIPWFIRKVIMWIIKKKEPRLAQIIKASRPLEGHRVFEKVYDVQKVLCPQVYKIFALNKLDAVVLPTFVTPAPKHGQIGKLQYFYSFATIWNILYYPVGTLPVTLTGEDQLEFNDQYNDFYTKNVRKSLVGSAGLPVGVQVASTPYNEQKVLHIMKQLEKQIKFRVRYPIPQ